MSRRRGVTYIELLVVAIIITVLMAIAVPNFLEASTRARVSQERADLVTIASAIESYRIDHRAYPLNREARKSDPGELTCITTPVAYMVSLPEFRAPYTDGMQKTRATYINLSQFHTEDEPFSVPIRGGMALYALAVPGPDAVLDLDATKTPVNVLYYDPTNGTISPGDHNVFGP